jgi:hypothetical protein
MEVIYISGPMTGYPNFNRNAFDEVEKYLISKGKEVVSPVLSDQISGKLTWKSCMRKSLQKLLHCNSIVMLPGWRESRGAKMERYLAEMLEYVIYENVDYIL